MFNWYTGDTFYDTALTAGLCFSVLVIIGSSLLKAPYGRFASGKFGVLIPSNWGWFLMELPASVTFMIVYFRGDNAFAPVPLFFLGVWCVHYGNRGFFFPLLMRVTKGRRDFSLFIVITGWFTTILHGYLNARFISHLGKHLGADWFTDPRFIIGMTIYAASLALNIYHDRIIRNLRTKEEVNRGEKNYRIPKGGLFTMITNPSYLTELTSWLGLAVATWSLGFVYILGVSAGNLIPRAIQTHAWYRETFPDYPRERKILLPWIW